MNRGTLLFLAAVVAVVAWLLLSGGPRAADCVEKCPRGTRGILAKDRFGWQRCVCTEAP